MSAVLTANRCRCSVQVLRMEQPSCTHCQSKLASNSLADYSISFEELDAVVVSNDASLGDPSSVDSTRPTTPEQPRSDDSRSTGTQLAQALTSVRPRSTQRTAWPFSAGACCTARERWRWPQTRHSCWPISRITPRPAHLHATWHHHMASPLHTLQWASLAP